MNYSQAGIPAWSLKGPSFVHSAPGAPFTVNVSQGPVSSGLTVILLRRWGSSDPRMQGWEVADGTMGISVTLRLGSRVLLPISHMTLR